MSTISDEDIVDSYDTKIHYEMCVLCDHPVFWSLLGWLHLDPIHDHRAQVKEQKDD